MNEEWKDLKVTLSMLAVLSVPLIFVTVMIWGLIAAMNK